jgi:hypothetical protein
MTTLHILRTKPDETVQALMESFKDLDGKTVPLFQGDVDWDQLVDDIYSSEQVISWW